LRPGRRAQAAKHDEQQRCVAPRHPPNRVDVIRCWGPGRERLIVVSVESV
jgi:hypothetical protein